MWKKLLNTPSSVVLLQAGWGCQTYLFRRNILVTRRSTTVKEDQINNGWTFKSCFHCSCSFFIYLPPLDFIQIRSHNLVLLAFVLLQQQRQFSYRAVNGPTWRTRTASSGVPPSHTLRLFIPSGRLPEASYGPLSSQWVKKTASAAWTLWASYPRNTFLLAINIKLS